MEFFEIKFDESLVAFQGFATTEKSYPCPKPGVDTTTTQKPIIVEEKGLSVQSNAKGNLGKDFKRVNGLKK